MAALLNHCNFKPYKPTTAMELDKISNIELANIDTSDYPDMVDAYIVSAEIDGVELTDAEIEELNCNSEFVYDCVLKELF
jgi:hypothetical protein